MRPRLGRDTGVSHLGVSRCPLLRTIFPPNRGLKISDLGGIMTECAEHLGSYHSSLL